MESLDTMVLLWGLKKEASPGQENMIKRAEKYLLYLQELGSRALVCAPVVCEYLVRFDTDGRKNQLRVLNESFIVAPFDVEAAEITAGLTHDKALLNQIMDETGVQWQCLKIDAMILGCSIAIGATRVLSDDPGMKKLAKGKILVSPLPARIPAISSDTQRGRPDDQPTLFDNE